MKTTTTGGRALSIAAGLLFTAGALGILLEDVALHAAPWTLKHGLTLVTVAGTIMVGHLAVEALAARHWLASFGFALLFVAGTALTVYNSVGRQAEHTMVKAAEAEAANEARELVRKGLASAEAMLTEAQRELARECKSGKGKRCDGIGATVAVYEAAVKGHKADLDRLGPAKIAVPEARRFGEIVAVFGYNGSKAEAGAILAIPFFTTLFLEFGAIVCLGYGFRRRAVSTVTASDTAQTSFAGSTPADTFSGELPDPVPPQPRKRRPLPTRLPANVVSISGNRAASVAGNHPALAALESVGGSVASNRELARLMGVTEGEASKRVAEIEHLVFRTRHGKEIGIALARKATA